MTKIRVLLVDDQVLFVQNLKIVLEHKAKDIEVVGVCYSGKDAIECVDRLKPEIVLMDIRMPLVDGVEATRTIMQRSPETKVLVLTTFDDDDYIYDALRYGAKGYLLKNIPPADLIAAIRTVREGHFLMSEQITRKVVGDIAHLRSRKSVDTQLDDAQNPLKALSKRELEVLRLIANGLDNAEIAAKLFIAEQTVKNHLHIIYSKIGARDRLQAMRIALASGLGVDTENHHN